MRTKKDNLFNLKGKNIVINGGYGLIGSNIVNDLLNYNANVTIIDIKKNTKKFDKINNFNFVSYNTSDTEQINNCFDKIINLNKKIHVFINCSYPINKLWIKNNFEEINSKSLNDNILLNSNSYILFSNLFAKHMKDYKIPGSIILFSSIYGNLAQDLSVYKMTKIKENVAYSFIKGGIINLTKQMASYYGKHNIRVNSISPGAVKGHIAGSKNKQPNIFIKNYINKNPIKRLCLPSDISPLCVFLSSDSSKYITGQNLIVDGGWSII